MKLRGAFVIRWIKDHGRMQASLSQNDIIENKPNRYVIVKNSEVIKTWAFQSLYNMSVAATNKEVFCTQLLSQSYRKQSFSLSNDTNNRWYVKFSFYFIYVWSVLFIWIAPISDLYYFNALGWSRHNIRVAMSMIKNR